MTEGLFALAGVVAGVAQAGMLARSAMRGPHPLSIIVRLLGVGVVLFFAARAGHLFAAACGWMAGFVVTGVLAYRRLR